MPTTYPNYNYYYRPPQQMEQQQTIPIGIKGRPVSSLEEAKAMPIDFDGSVFYFPDLANKRIYTKQINLDGTASLNVYEYKEVPPPQAYVTKEELSKAIQDLRQSLMGGTEQAPIPQF